MLSYHYESSSNIPLQDNELAMYDAKQEVEHQKLVALQREVAEREQQKDHAKPKENDVTIR